MHELARDRLTALQLSHRSGVQCPSVAPRRAGGPVNRGDAETRCASLQKYVKYLNLKMKIVSAVHQKSLLSEEWCRDRAVSVVGHLSAICWSGLRVESGSEEVFEKLVPYFLYSCQEWTTNNVCCFRPHLGCSMISCWLASPVVLLILLNETSQEACVKPGALLV